MIHIRVANPGSNRYVKRTGNVWICSKKGCDKISVLKYGRVLSVCDLHIHKLLFALRTTVIVNNKYRKGYIDCPYNLEIPSYLHTSIINTVLKLLRCVFKDKMKCL